MEQKTAYKIWSKEEVKLLKKWWNKKNEKAIAQMLGRTAVAVHLKAAKEGLTKVKQTKTKSVGAVQMRLPLKEANSAATAKVQKISKEIEAPQSTPLTNNSIAKEVTSKHNSYLKLLVWSAIMSTLAFLSSLTLLILKLI